MGQRSGDRRVRRTKRAIREAVSTLLEEVDYEKLTVTAVAREADIDRKTFYLHYSSIDDVLDEIIREDTEQMVELWRDELASGDGTKSATEMLASVCVVLVQNMTRSGAVLRHMAPDVLLSKVEEPLTQAIIEQDALGIASAMGDDLPYGVSFFCSGMLAVIQCWLEEDSDKPLEELVNMVSVMVTGGVEGLLREAGARAEA